MSKVYIVIRSGWGDGPESKCEHAFSTFEAAKIFKTSLELQQLERNAIVDIAAAFITEWHIHNPMPSMLDYNGDYHEQCRQRAYGLRKDLKIYMKEKNIKESIIELLWPENTQYYGRLCHKDEDCFYTESLDLD